VLTLPLFPEKKADYYTSLRTCATPSAKLKPVRRFGIVTTHSDHAITCFENAKKGSPSTETHDQFRPESAITFDRNAHFDGG
jgi:hypothetical protein